MYALLLLVVVVHALPSQYRGWTNDCTLYFQDSPHNSIADIFLFCLANRCEEYFLSACDKMGVQRETDLSACMNLCCSPSSKYQEYESVVAFLEACQQDYFLDANRELARLNRLPLVLFVAIFGGALVVTLVVIIFCFYEDIIDWIRRRYNRRPNGEDIELQLYMH